MIVSLWKIVISHERSHKNSVFRYWQFHCQSLNSIKIDTRFFLKISSFQSLLGYQFEIQYLFGKIDCQVLLWIFIWTLLNPIANGQLTIIRSKPLPLILVLNGVTRNPPVLPQLSGIIDGWKPEILQSGSAFLIIMRMIVLLCGYC